MDALLHDGEPIVLAQAVKVVHHIGRDHIHLQVTFLRRRSCGMDSPSSSVSGSCSPVGATGKGNCNPFSSFTRWSNKRSHVRGGDADGAVFRGPKEQEAIAPGEIEKPSLPLLDLVFDLAGQGNLPPLHRKFGRYCSQCS